MTRQAGFSLSITVQPQPTQNITVSWDATGADGVTLDGAAVSVVGTKTELLTDGHTYTLAGAMNVMLDTVLGHLTIRVSPKAPTNVSASANSATQATVTWTNNATTQTGYRVNLYASNGTTLLNSTDHGANDVSHVESNLTPSTTYIFKVAAFDANSISPFVSSNSLTMPPAPPANPPNAPSNLTIDTPTQPDRLTCRWTDNSLDETNFILEWKKTSDPVGSFAPITLPANTTSSTVASLLASTSYDFRVKARNANGDSAYSNTATASTTGTPSSPPNPPAAPTLNSVTVNASSPWLTANFTAGDSSADCFIGLISNDGVNYREGARAPAGATTMSFYGAQPNTIYGIRIAALAGSAGISSVSNLKTATVGDVIAAAPGNPTSLRALAASDTEIYVDWHIPTPGETGNVLEMSSDGGSTWPTTFNVPANWTFYKVGSLPASSTRHFRLKRTTGAGTHASGYSNVANATTLGSGQVWSPTGTNPLFILHRGWYESWHQAKLDYEANPSNPATFGGVAYKQLKTEGDKIGTPNEPYPNSRVQAALLYILTGDSTYATKVYNAQPFNTATLNGTVTAVTDAQHFTLSNTTNNFTGYKIWFNTGVNADLSIEAKRITADSVGVITTNVAFPNPPGIGDAYTVQLEINITGNESREQQIEWTYFLDWLRPALTADQIHKWMAFLNTVAETNLAINNEAYMGGFRITDSDATSANYLALRLWDILGPILGNPRSAFTSLSANGIPMGGVTGPTGLPDFTTARNGLAQFSAQGRYGSWPESADYNTGTISLVTSGVMSAYTATNADDYPEVTRTLIAAARAASTLPTPNLLYDNKWGDNDTAQNGVWQPNTMTYELIVHGISCRIDDLGPYVFDVGYQWWQVLKTNTPYGRGYIYFDPYATRSSFLSQPTFYLGGGEDRYELKLRGGVLSSDSIANLNGFCRTAIDHGLTSLGTSMIYRKAERVIRAPVAYGSWSTGLYGPNGILPAGLGQMASWNGPAAADCGSGWAYLCTSTGGPWYGGDYYQPPPTFLHEVSSSLVVFLGANRKSDLVIDYSRGVLANLKLLTRLNHYRSPFSVNTSVSVSPSPTSTVFGVGLTQATVDYYKNKWVYFTSGTLSGQVAKILGSTATPVVLTVDSSLSGAPASGNTLEIDSGGDFGNIMTALALMEQTWHTETLPTLTSAKATWTTTGGQAGQIEYLLPSPVTLLTFNENVDYDPFSLGMIVSEAKYHVRSYDNEPWPTDAFVRFKRYLSVASAADAGFSPTSDLITAVDGSAEGGHIARPSENDCVAMFGAKQTGRVLFSGYTFSYTQSAATCDVVLVDLSPSKTWRYAVDGGPSSLLTVLASGAVKFQVGGVGPHTIVLSAT